MTGSFRETAHTEPIDGGAVDWFRDPEFVIAPEGPDFAAIQRSEEFSRLRTRIRRFVFPMSAAFFSWYVTYVVCAAYADGFMRERVVGEVNVGIVFALLQFVSTIGIVVLYGRYARRRIDPAVDAVRELAGETG